MRRHCRWRASALALPRREFLTLELGDLLAYSESGSPLPSSNDSDASDEISSDSYNDHPIVKPENSMNRMRTLLLFAFVITLGVSASVPAQQTEQRKPRSPRLTTDDVLRAAKPVTETSAPVVVDANKAGTDVKSSASASGDAKPADAQAAGGKTSTEELAWRERIAKARQRSESLERAAEEAEIRTTQLRNQLSQQGQSASDRNAIAAAMDSAGKQVTDLRNQARAAKADLGKLVEEGAEKGFREAPAAKATTADGKPNEAYFRQRYDKLMQTMRDTERRIQLYENRVRSLNEMITNPNRDRFSGAQLEQDRNDAQDSLNAARTTYRKVQEDLYDLQEEARRAGISPGVFR